MPRAKPARRVRTIYKTPWFALESFKHPHNSQSYYRLTSPDSAAVLAVTPDKKIIIVRQYRPAIGKSDMELPAGHMNKGETPVQTARREFLEETGYECESFVPLGMYRVANSRLNHKVYAFFGRNARPAKKYVREKGIARILVSEKQFHQLIKQRKFVAIASIGFYYLAKTRGLI